MEWEVSLHLITDNMSINHKYVFFFKPGRGRSRSKFIVSKEECSPQSWRGKKAGGQRDESAFQKAWIQEEHRAWKPGLWTKASFLCIFFSWVTYSGSTVTGNIKDPTVPETSPPNPGLLPHLCSDAEPQVCKVDFSGLQGFSQCPRALPAFPPARAQFLVVREVRQGC